ncbi:hypothetical protein FO519_008653 [Halicephalobus sp. NKZ332]|nr:hypothetical protein FO519_008653 [Halicephalobus sp. NKZ332]
MASTQNQLDNFPSTITNTEEENDSDRYVATSIMFAIGVCGLMANTIAIRIIWKSKNLHNCFGYLLLLHASAEALVLCSFIFWAVPMNLLLLSGSLYFFPGCNYYYDSESFTWTYDDTPCYDIMAYYTDLIVGCSIMGVTMFIDMCTLCLIMKHRLFNKKSNKEVRFFTQTFSTSILYTLMLIITQLFSDLVDNNWRANLDNV